MDNYTPDEIESKWQKAWLESGIYKVDLSRARNKFYLLVEFTYPSGDLHMGHWFAFAVPDILARYKRMNGFEVFAPNGFDAFGLPAENAAISRGIHPRDWTYANIKRMREQFETMGISFDWEREVITSDVDYYRWNQWIFLKMYEKGLAYRGGAMANWCPKDQCVLANENVEDGKCWRCGTEVVQKEVDQWFLKITEYAEKLIWKDTANSRGPVSSFPPAPSQSSGQAMLGVYPERSRRAVGSPSRTATPRISEAVDWPQSVKEGQNNWIGKSEGAAIKFKVISYKSQIEVFTTRPDTLFGATFLVLAPEHPIVASFLKIKNQKSKIKEIKDYVEKASRMSELERKEMKEKTGVFTGAYAVNPANAEEIPIWVADYVLMGYGTGAIMAVPAHDERDFEFAKKYRLPIIPVILNESEGSGDSSPAKRVQNDKE